MWVLVVMIATLVTFMLPESFSSTTRIKIERDHSDIPGMTSISLSTKVWVKEITILHGR